MSVVKIAVIDDQNLFREGLATLIRSADGLSLTGDFMNGAVFLQALNGTAVVPDVALVDLEMPEMNGIQLTQKLREDHPEVKVIVLSVHNEKALIAHLIEEGVHGYLEKNCDSAELVTAIKCVHRNGFYMNLKTFDALQHTARFESRPNRNLTGFPVTLSAKEKEVLRLICTERNSAEIAAELHLSARTVEWHRKNLLQKTGSRNTAGLVLFSIRTGLYFA